MFFEDIGTAKVDGRWGQALKAAAFRCAEADGWGWWLGEPYTSGHGW